MIRLLVLSSVPLLGLVLGLAGCSADSGSDKNGGAVVGRDAGDAAASATAKDARSAVPTSAPTHSPAEVDSSVALDATAAASSSASELTEASVATEAGSGECPLRPLTRPRAGFKGQPVCVGSCGYVYQGYDLDEFNATDAEIAAVGWYLVPGICPALSAEQCQGLAEELDAVNAPCEVDADCELVGNWGQTCDGEWNTVAFSHSLVAPAADNRRALDLWQQLENGVCGASNVDGPVWKAACVNHQCSHAERGQCGAPDPIDAAVDAGTRDADADAPDADLRDTGILDASVYDARD